MENFQLKHYHYGQTVNALNNDTYSLDLARSFFMRNLKINVRALITVAGFGAGDVYTEDFQYKLLKRIKLYNGIDTPWNISGRMLGHANHRWGMVAPDFFATPLADGQMTIEFTYVMPFGDENSRKELETYIKSWGYNTLRLDLETFDDPAEIIATAAGVLTVNRVEIRVRGEVMDLDRSYRNKIAEKNTLIRRVIENAEETVNLITYPHNFRDAQLERDKTTRALFLLTEDAVVGKYGARLDELLTDISLYYDGVDILPQIDEAFLRFENTRAFHINMPDGIYVIDCDQEGDHIGLPSPTSKQDFFLRFGTFGPVVPGAMTRIVCVQDEIDSAKYVE